MEHLGSLDVFVRAAEARSFTAAAQQLGLSTSAVSKAIVRLETRVGVRLFHRSTRTVALTPEGTLFLGRCRRILGEVEAAECELQHLQNSPRGKLRISLPSIGMLFIEKIAAFKAMYPEIELDIDYGDRYVEMIEEGFDVVIRTGEPTDSRLITRTIGNYRRVIVGNPDYFSRAGKPERPEDLVRHACLLYRYPSTGKLDVWPLGESARFLSADLPVSMVANTLAPLVCFAEQGLGVTCIPDIAIREQLASGSLVSVLDDYNSDVTTFRVMWPSSRQLAPKLRVFVDYVAEHLLRL
ncbi:LysR family transcriptional regulator [Burkholderia plantarii]|uniref:Transcriptional regulator LysR family n=1 Tax=Burkholderia plantarii TaxID=41899 RepID=A0A0B6SAN4_BURPL|nr:LysR family transcriptional regulator [Burkholderia plantarii]AJK50315.1 transcriptional regulator LysR family [Burkholderia plantarii]ALK34487.1 LysR family transcriptional regulator [Burkholderia plantarii]WLE63516.1 LysR family transcriptional regulator [Burkholderia plantarii]GLZ21231.1 LysR family transcriptional regulator [Burkholderia plantarii]